MKARILFPVLWLIFLLTIPSCSLFNRDQLDVSRNFGDQVAVKQNLTFVFSTALAPADLIDSWQDTPYIRFQPEVKGKFRWSSESELVFSPEEGFAPSTRYQAAYTPELWKHQERKFKLAEEAFSFSTPMLEVLNANPRWTMDARRVPVVKVNLRLNYRVRPTDLNQRLRVKVGSTDIAYAISGEEESEEVELTLQPGGDGKIDGLDFTILLEKGLAIAGGGTTEQDVRFESTLPSREDFRVLHVMAEPDGAETVVQVYLNQAIAEADFAKLIRFTPSVRFSVERLDFGFLIRGAFSEEESYRLTVSRDLASVFDTKLGTDFEQSIAFGELAPGISFVHNKALYLSSKGERNVGVRIVNIPEIEVSIYKIYQNNIMAYLRENYVFSDWGDYDYDRTFYTNFEDFGTLLSQKSYKSAQLRKSGLVSLIPMVFEQPANNRNGIYVVRVASKNENYIRTDKILSISDLGLITKASNDEVLVMVNSLQTAQPVANAEVVLHSTNNQEIGKAKTDANGMARFSNLKNTAKGFRPGMVTAMSADDFNYLHFRETRIETSRFDVGGLRSNQAGLMAYIYGDRNLYRPDETMYFKTVVRNTEWNAPGSQPVKVRVLLPDGGEFLNRRGTLSAEGTFEWSVKLPAAAVTGSYRVELLSANDVLLASKDVAVEDFMPDRLKVDLRLNKSLFAPGETLVASGTATNMFGPPAANRRYEMEMMLNRKEFAPKGLERYVFELSGRQEYLESQYRQGMTDEAGLFSEQFVLPPSYQNHGLLEARFYTNVTDENGRPVRRMQAAEVLTQEVFYGIGISDRYVAARQAINIPIIAVNHQGQVFKEAQARIQVIRHEWQSVLERDYSDRLRYQSQRKEEVLTDQTIKITGSGASFPFVPAVSGEYEVRLMHPGAESYVSYFFYAYSFGLTSSTAFEVNREGNVSIEMDKESYAPGQTAQLILKAPFAGRLILTVERDRIFEHFVLQTDGKAASFSLPIKPEYLPNVYVTATLIKPLTDQTLPLTVAHGFVPLKVEDPKTRFEVSIGAPEKVRSLTKQEVTVNTGVREANVEVTVAVIDEGILQIRNYQTPDPHAFFYQKMALEVESYNIYPRIFPEIRPQSFSFGSDGYDLGRRVNPLANKRVKLLSFWSGTLKTDGSGQVKYTVDLPQFSGEVRIMAVAAKGNRFGSAQKAMKVADPVVISSGLPRFLSPGDQAVLPVTLSNTTDKAISATVTVAAEGVVSAGQKTSETVSLPPNGEKMLTFSVQAANQVGLATVRVEAQANGETYRDVTDLTVRPPVSLLKRSGSGVVAGKPATIDLKQDFMSSSVQARLWVSRMPVTQYANNLAQLVQYPYGCIEQTVSAAFPQLYFQDLTAAMGQAIGRKQNPAQNVQEAIRKIYSMQLYNGGLAYWPGGNTESWWGSIYAAHFLQEAKKAGYEVDDRFMDRLYSYLREMTRRKERQTFQYTNASGAVQSRNIAPQELFYSLYVLAGAGRREASVMNFYKNRLTELSPDSRYLLACAYQLAGDAGSYRTLLPQQFGEERAVRTFGGSFSSFLRDYALTLNALIETDPQNAQVPAMAKRLADLLAQQPYPNTQEMSFSLLALGKLAQKGAASNATATLSAGGKEVARFDGTPLLVDGSAIAGKSVSIQPQGEGPLYYFWQMDGLNETGAYPQEDRFLKVRREYFDRNGNRISGNTFRQHDLVAVKITLQSDGPEVQNVVVTDLLPGGFEVENPRIGGLPGLAWIKDATEAEHIDFRDDRISLFTTARSQPATYYYLVRAVSKGTFVQGPVSADAMYNADYRSYHGAGTVVVE